LTAVAGSYWLDVVLQLLLLWSCTAAIALLFCFLLYALGALENLGGLTKTTQTCQLADLPIHLLVT
jgi:hypothetical protein